jgi:eukaryotic-like serine/threonine-protein kinase
MDIGYCVSCALPDIAHSYDLAGNRDSAIAVFARYVETPNRSLVTDQYSLAGAHKRLGELYEERGDRAKAASEFTAFVELWKNADPDLQPLVAEVRKRLARLGSGEPRN